MNICCILVLCEISFYSSFSMVFRLGPKQIHISARWMSIKEKLSGYKFPEIRKDDCEQKYVSGWGPGGQKVNTAQNAVQLRHIPTGLVVKVHESRLLHKNIDIAFDRLKHMVDRHLNGENCYEEQYKRLQREKEIKAKKKRGKQRALRMNEALSDNENI